MDQQQGQGETFAAAVHYFRRMVCLRFMVRQALFATDEIDDELPSFEDLTFPNSSSKESVALQVLLLSCQSCQNCISERK